jgi:gas vesicle protein
MSRVWNEQKVLKKLEIEDFRHLTKDKVIAMASMLDKMDPEVAEKALAQFPEFAQTVQKMLSEYKETLDQGMEANKESVQSYYDCCHSILESLQAQLEKENLSFEERKYIVDRMLEVSKMMGEKDSENKKFITALVVVSAAAVSVAAVALASVLGGNISIGMDEIDKWS